MKARPGPGASPPPRGLRAAPPAGPGAWGVRLEVAPGAAAAVCRDTATGPFLREQLERGGGLVLAEGFAGIAPEDLVALSGQLGTVESNPGVDARYLELPEVQRIGSDPGRALFSKCKRPSCKRPGDNSFQYDPTTRSPVWHTDQLMRDPQPLGSLLLGVTCPPEGAATCFASTALAYEALTPEERAEVDELWLVSSYAHHNAKIRYTTTPTYPLLTDAEQERFPPLLRPVIAPHPKTGRRAFNAFSSSVCAVLHTRVEAEALDVGRYELTGEEHPSVRVFLDRWLPWVTRPQFTTVHQWRAGDLAVWDNRVTIHAATWYDHEVHEREMWRTTVCDDLR